MDFIIEAAEKLFVLDVIPYNWMLSDGVDEFCSLLKGRICGYIASVVFGYDSLDVDNYADGRVEVYFSYLPTDAGIFNYVHYGQLYHEDKPRFRRFDLGSEMNMKKYNQTTPPDYDLKALNFPVAIFQGKYDPLADTKDVAWLEE